MAKLVGNVAPFDITEVAHPAPEFLAIWIVVRGSRSDVSHVRGFAGLLRARRERPRCRRAAEQRDELAPLHSITSSARRRNASGIVSPSALALVRLMTRSNLAGCSTGMSPGFAPRRILSTSSAARRNKAGMFG